ncbi:MAG TPA: MFS transporter [Steroidobacteraceae bacterium]|nr:MFS transporter [Steroidobacteraceae bacterium]
MNTGATGARAILAASMGNLLEWYDFAVYALFAIPIAANFFPGERPGIDLINAFLFFGAGFVIRPAGAIVMGIYGDRAGRKAALMLTILLMASGTLIIAAAPTYAVIGLGAPVVLLAGRLLQGFSAGGEIGSAAAYLVEHAPPRRRATFAAWLQGSMGMSNILGALVAFTISATLAPAQIVHWGWRLPFFLGLAIVPLGVYLRRTLEETPAFLIEQAHPVRAPLRSVVRDHGRELLAGFGISIPWAAAVYVLLIYMPTYLQKSQGFTPMQAFGGSLVENVVFVIGCFAFGALADRLGHAKVQARGALALFFGVLPLFWWISHTHSAAAHLAALAALGLIAASFTSVAPSVLSHLFPTRVRVTGVSLVYNAAFTIFGGFAPAILLKWFASGAAGAALAPAWYVTLAAIPALLAMRSATRSPRWEAPIQET